METYTLPRETFDLLIENFGNKEKAERFARGVESAVDIIHQKAEEKIIAQKQLLKAEVKDELRNELVTRELFEERFKSVDERFNALQNLMLEKFKLVDERFKLVDERFKMVDERFAHLNFKMNIFIAIALISLTFANPTFVALIQKLF